MADNAFIAMAQEVAAQNSEDMKMQRMDAIINNNCLTTAQAMKLSTLLLNESNRLGFLKKAYSKTFDIGNFQQAVMVFSLIPNQNNFLSFLNANNPTNCTVSADEFKEIKNRISRESFDNTRKNTAKSILQSKKCFTTQQVKEMVAIFSFSDSKMEIAKFAYDFTTDRENYYVVADAFTFPSDKDKLLKFIESRK
jgi:predicted Zn-dependent peptidase